MPGTFPKAKKKFFDTKNSTSVFPALPATRTKVAHLSLRELPEHRQHHDHTRRRPGLMSGPTETSRELAGRVAVVTGAGSGLGAAIARQCAEAGMTVAALDIDEPRAQATASELAEMGVPTAAMRVDVGDPASVRDAADRVDEQFGGCDLLCANVGVQQFGSIDRLTEDDWAWLLGVNVLGTVRTVTSFLPGDAPTHRLAPYLDHRVVGGVRAQPFGSAPTPRASSRSPASPRRCASSSPTKASA